MHFNSHNHTAPVRQELPYPGSMVQYNYHTFCPQKTNSALIMRNIVQKIALEACPNQLSLTTTFISAREKNVSTLLFRANESDEH